MEVKIIGLSASTIGAIAATQKGQPLGVASLNENGVVPGEQLPAQAIPTPSQVGAIALTQKGQPGGVAELGENGTVPPEQLPAVVIPTPSQVGAIALTQKGQPGGVAELGEDGTVPPEQLPPIVLPTAEQVGAIATSAKGEPRGVAELNENGVVPGEQLPTITLPTAEDWLNLEPLLVNSWQPISDFPLRCYRYLGRCYVQGAIRSGILNSICFELPLGFRPDSTARAVALGATGAWDSNHWLVNPQGQVFVMGTKNGHVYGNFSFRI